MFDEIQAKTLLIKRDVVFRGSGSADWICVAFRVCIPSKSFNTSSLSSGILESWISSISQVEIVLYCISYSYMYSYDREMDGWWHTLMFT